MGRIQSVDALRAVAVIKMLLCHFVLYLSANADPESWIVPALCGPFASFGAQFFAFAVGMSFHLSLEKHHGSDVSRRYVRRAISLFVLGLVFAALAWSPSHMLDWDILTLIGFSIALLTVIRHFPSGAILALAVVAAAAAPLLREWLDFASYWQSLDYLARWDGIHDVIGFFVTGYFPVFPWVVFPLIGLVVARVLFPRPGEMAAPETASRLVLCAGVLLIVGPSIRLVGNPFAWNLDGTFYPLSTFRLFWSLGFTLSVFLLFHLLFDRRQTALPQYFRGLSRSSLSIYLAHHFLVLWPLWLIGLASGDVGRFFQVAISPLVALVLGIAFLLLWFPLSQVWGRSGYRFGAEWLLARIVDRPPRPAVAPVNER